nr:HIT domain protein [uncultured bacterium]
MNKLLHIRNARVPEQRAQMEDLQRRKVCAFCRKHFEENHKNPILFENQDWLLAKNDYPYEGTRVHLLLVHKRHVEDMANVTSRALYNLAPVLRWAKKRFRIKGSTFLMRSGDMRYNGATVSQLHAHIIVGVREGKGTEPIKRKLGFKKK